MYDVIVCQLLHGLEVGGAEVLSARLARQLRGKYRFLFVCLDQKGSLGEELEAEGFPVHCLARRAGLDLGCIRRLSRLFEQEGVDLIHAHQYGPFSYGAMARSLGRLSVPLLFTEHGRHFPDVTSRKRRLANRWLLRPSDRVIGVGNAVREALIKNEGFASQRVGVIYNGIPLDRFGAGSSVDRDRIRHELGISADSFVLAQVARLDYLKDHATALRMIRRVADRLPGAQLLLVGEGPERTQVESLIAQLGLANQVRLLGQRSDVPCILQASDVVILTSISEGIPLTLIEAMAAELPVVATDVGGVNEVVVHGKTGLLAGTGDDSALAQHVIELAGDRHARERMGRLGQARARALFSESRMHSGYVELFESLCATRAAFVGGPARLVFTGTSPAGVETRRTFSATLNKGVE